MLLDWKRYHDEALAAWTGFLWAPRLYLPLLAAIKPVFIETAGHFGELGEVAHQYATLLTYAALEAPEPFTRKGLSRCDGAAS